MFTHFFAEFITLKEIDGINKQQVKQAYLEYLEFGGMPSVLDAQVVVENQYDYLSTLYDSIMLRDVSQRSG